MAQFGTSSLRRQSTTGLKHLLKTVFLSKHRKYAIMQHPYIKYVKVEKMLVAWRSFLWTKSSWLFECSDHADLRCLVGTFLHTYRTYIKKTPDAKTLELKSTKTCKSVRCLTPTQHLFFLSVTQPICWLRYTRTLPVCVSHKGTHAWTNTHNSFNPESRKQASVTTRGRFGWTFILFMERKNLPLSCPKLQNRQNKRKPQRAWSLDSESSNILFCWVIDV